MLCRPDDPPPVGRRGPAPTRVPEHQEREGTSRWTPRWSK